MFPLPGFTQADNTPELFVASLTIGTISTRMAIAATHAIAVLRKIFPILFLLRRSPLCLLKRARLSNDSFRF